MEYDDIVVAHYKDRETGRKIVKLQFSCAPYSNDEPVIYTTERAFKKMLIRETK